MFYNDYFPAQYPEYKYVFDFLYTNICNTYNFLFQISASFQNMCQKDQNKIICNAIHSIRLLQLANSNNTNNYFDSDNQTYEAVCGCLYIINLYNQDFTIDSKHTYLLKQHINRKKTYNLKYSLLLIKGF